MEKQNWNPMPVIETKPELPNCKPPKDDCEIRTKGYGWIEIKPLINEKYCIYLDKKGFYCNVLKHKIYLKDIFE